MIAVMTTRTRTAKYAPPKSPDGETPLPPIRAGFAIVRRDDEVPLDLLQTFWKNPNTGDRNTIAQSLEVNGLFRGVVANVGTLTGRAYEVLAGNHTFEEFRDAGAETIAVDWVDQDEAGCVRIMSVDNAAAKKGKIDTDVLSSLLVDLDSLAGTGVTDAELARMVGGSGEQNTDEQLQASFALIIDCDDETQQGELLARFEEEGLNARPLMM